MSKNRLKEVEQITRDLYRNYCHGDPTLWFDVLYKDCVWVGPGEPTLIGADKIKEYFSNYNAENVEIINESYTSMKLSSTSYLVSGNVLVGADASTPTASVLMTMAYRYVNNNAKLTYQHMSYDFIHPDLSHISPTSKKDRPAPYNPPTELATRLLIRQTLLAKDHLPPIGLKSGTQTYYVSPASIIYLQSNGHKTNVYCVDKVLECSMLITDIAPMLPKRFYFIRRGCIVNTMYITAIRRCEAELVFGTIIQIPTPNYTTVKKELNELIIKQTGEK